ncbi:MAG TPA: carbonic anhydrase [Candidatus Kapabacteria bacterium]|nr:carbonic anhydrase [Candidatus Kapabacteria bacterium]
MTQACTGVRAAIALCIVAGVLNTGRLPAQGRCAPGSGPELTPQAALDSLIVGNVRFVRDSMLHRSMRCGRDSTALKQRPFAAVLTCVDSRTPPEYLFDRGLGEVFTARVAGNVLNSDVLGSLEFAVAMGAKVIVVMGHTNCGAVNAAIDHNYSFLNLTDLLVKMEPAIQAVDSTLKPRSSLNPAFVKAVTYANVLIAMDQIPKRSPYLKGMIDAGRVRLLGSVYDVDTGLVRFNWEYKPQK